MYSPASRLARAISALTVLTAGAAWWPASPAHAAQLTSDMWVQVTPEEVSTEPGDTITVTITIGNHGPEDSIDPRYTFSASPRAVPVGLPEACARDDTTFPTYTCPITGLAAGAQINQELSFEIVGFNIGQIGVHVWDAQPGERDGRNNRDFTLVHTPLAELWATMSPESATVDVGEPVELTFTVGNNGPRDAIDPYFIIGHLGRVEAVSVPDGCQQIDEDSYDCPIDSLAAGTQLTDTLTVRLVAVDEAHVFVSVHDRATDESSDVDGGATISASTTSDLVVTATRVRVETELNEPFDVSVTIHNAGPRGAGEIELRLGFGLENEPLFPVTRSIGEDGEPVGENPQPDGCDRSGLEGPPIALVCPVASLPTGASTDVVVRLSTSRYGTYTVPVVARLLGEDELEAPGDRANNEARLTVEVVPPGTGDGGEGGELPKTGTSLTGLVATGLALAAVGSVVAVLTRRRRGPA